MTGAGFIDRDLSVGEVRAILADAFDREAFEGKKMLMVIPDNTRTAPIGLMFREIAALLQRRVKQLDVLVALGTHPPMSNEAIDRRLEMAPGERQSQYPDIRVFNHQWKDPSQLATIGTITENEVENISRGLMRERVSVTINKLVLDYDLLMVVGPTFPHEVAGFSGGNKYLFPGISGPEIIDMFHWLGALITSPVIIGRKHTPVRAVVNRAASLLRVKRYCCSLVVRGQGLAGLYCGTSEEAWEAAATLSDKVHVVYKDRAYHRVLSCAPAMYDDLWVGAKCTYKLEPVVADGGEVIIYAPHIKEISVTHGRLIGEIGYHVRDYFLAHMDRFRHIPRGVLAHSTHVRGVGAMVDGAERPRISVLLATGIPEDVCRKVNLGYRDPRAITMDEWKDRETEGVLFVPKAGEILYRLTKDPFPFT